MNLLFLLLLGWTAFIGTPMSGAVESEDPPSAATTQKPPDANSGAPIGPVEDRDFHEDGKPAREKVELGRLLFFDKVLSGNRNISCATCHHPEFGSGDAVALPLGEGPSGRGPDRQAGSDPGATVHGRVPRNSPPLWNLGAREFTRLFYDGRVEADTEGRFPGGFATPANWRLPVGLEGVLAAQAMFPVTSHDEMAGQRGENEIADALAGRPSTAHSNAWQRLAQRLQKIPEYVDRFRAAFPSRIRKAEQIRFVDAANAIAAFEAAAFRSDRSPYDALLRREAALPESAEAGRLLFYGKARCGSCHSGKFQTDHDFHAIAMPQIGPGKGDGRRHELLAAHGAACIPRGFRQRPSDPKTRRPIPVPYSQPAQRRPNGPLGPRGRIRLSRGRRPPPSRSGRLSSSLSGFLPGLARTRDPGRAFPFRRQCRAYGTGATSPFSPARSLGSELRPTP